VFSKTLGHPAPIRIRWATAAISSQKTCMVLVFKGAHQPAIFKDTLLHQAVVPVDMSWLILRPTRSCSFNIEDCKLKSVEVDNNLSSAIDPLAIFDEPKYPLPVFTLYSTTSFRDWLPIVFASPFPIISAT
jgi:hypothetical protein